ncbi:hypothetical protein [Lacihabitans sp. LS3-19]|uniref:hypothetical protein n=1 Tax=Lacihabitans sp. LS3-19 TaxID=2487335 RepID=UPI0020CD672E|nr:hypothetical protein [Lacihabitans sp. LS3-19]
MAQTTNGTNNTWHKQHMAQTNQGTNNAWHKQRMAQTTQGTNNTMSTHIKIFFKVLKTK